MHDNRGVSDGAIMPSISLKLLILLLWTIVAVPIQAELSPDAYAELKAEATEVMSINVTDVTNVTGTTVGDNCTLFFAVDAVVLDVNRSGIGYGINDIIAFEAYTRDRSSAECELFVGPGAPNLLEGGWCGLVYLNPPDESSDLLQPAAYGQSFEEYTAQQCEAAAALGASNPDPSSGASAHSMHRDVLISSILIISIFSFLSL